LKSKREIAQEIADEIGIHTKTTFTSGDVFLSAKDQLRIHIDALLERSVPARVIEIELLHYMKSILYSDRH
jgi:hypothetical protein